MKKLLILSGKGGTGKTTTAAAFLRFSGARAAADCDVDAPNLHMVTALDGEPVRGDFYGSDKARVSPAKCTGCGACLEHCRFSALKMENGVCRVSETACEGCGVCAWVCPSHAVTMAPDVAGTTALYTGGRVFSTAELKMGRGNSGKLVTAVKQSLFRAASDAELAVIDGSPGIGCPVIASVSGADLVLVVAEPSLSGLSDLERLVHTAETLQAPLAVCVNKWDASPENADAIQAFCRSRGIPFLGRIPYDKTASAAVNGGYSVSDVDCPARDALWAVFREAMKLLELPCPEGPAPRGTAALPKSAI